MNHARSKDKTIVGPHPRFRLFGRLSGLLRKYARLEGSLSDSRDLTIGINGLWMLSSFAAAEAGLCTKFGG